MIEFPATGTKWQINSNSEISIDKIKELTENYENNFSRFRENSLISKISRTPGKYLVPDEAEDLFNFYFLLNKATGGKFTMLIGRLLNQTGYDSKYSLNPLKKLIRTENVSDVIEYEHPFLIMKKPYQIDLGAAGKGQLVEIIKNYLENEGHTEFTIDAGGDLIHRSKTENKLKVGLENPDNFDEVIGITEIENQSICGSSGNRRKWSTFHHIIDPFLRKSPTNIKASWVIHNNAMVADGLATALFLDTPEKLSKYFDFEFLVLYKDNSVKRSPNFRVDLF